LTEDRREEWVNTPQQARSQETLDRFLEATEQLLREKPFDDITIAEIVDRAGRTVGSFYARFDDKIGVVKTLTARRLAAMRYLGDEMLDPEVWKSYTVRELVETSMKTLCNLYETYGHVFRAGLTMPANDAEGQGQRNRHYDHLAKQLCSALIAHPEVDETARLASSSPPRWSER